MGCRSSKTCSVEPFLDENERVHSSARGDSAASNNTTDSGLGLEPPEGATVRGINQNMLSQLTAPSPGLASSCANRLDSSEILEQLLSQGIIPAQSRHASSGEAYSLMMKDEIRTKKRPPLFLESLKLKRGQGVMTKEELDERMKRVEERRQAKEEKLKTRLRAKSARLHPACHPTGRKERETPILTSVMSCSTDPE
ncbi:stathmin domain-containing protein 1 [Denticeps clupeoides]|uniref:stathmin domain-containing protein 1 n=1 Tax=Denticeps clupeoides TaxID=299321 RepID=UPI0010A596BD|nr:stathmin domain-containing protein 1 [Denticeps clupeoides]